MRARRTRGRRLRRQRAIRLPQRRSWDRAESRGHRQIASFRPTDPAGARAGRGKRAPATVARSPVALRPRCRSRRRQLRRKLARSLGSRRPVRAPAAPAQFQVGIVAAQAALGKQHGDVCGGGAEASIAGVQEHMRQPRLERQRRDRPAVGSHSPSSSIAPSVASLLRASSSAAAGGASRNGRRDGSASPHSRQVSSRLDRSASRISGGSCAGSDAVAASSHRRIATPGACRAARPARCVTAARLARSVTSRVRPAPRSSAGGGRGRCRRRSGRRRA